MTTETAAKKDIQKLQRAIIDGLEDVKAQDIQVFNTEKLSALFERVMVASGTSNRQTKALAASVRDAVRDAGFAKPRMEGEENGEWIIVDCGAAVVHIMQPAIRQYYHLEDLWGETPVRLKFGADKPAAKVVDKAPAKAAAPAKTGSLRRASAAKQGVAEAYPSRAQLKKAEEKKAADRKKAAGKPAARKTVAAKAPAAKTTAKAPIKTVKVNAAKAPAKKTAAKTAAKPASKAAKAPAKKTATRKAR
ncbi:ribosome silencing factor [Rhodoferax sp. BAB1]|uniref:ribosome silencing factor n=1 Tax=Rhodoferax sp. BAB1 TaxID=2741720 RepID=UPI001576F9C2|nr:ribosome silencing factor [Rhodoferax sp. BAB1]QKO21903.1 ribosome silencing factor [Rhodoferax sp. BAB1]